MAVAEHYSQAVLPADQVPVSLFREILIWPLALHLSPSSDPDAVRRAVEDVAKNIEGNRTSRWHAVADPTKHIPPPRKSDAGSSDDREMTRWNADRYAESLYFHEFVQSFLFRNQRDGAKEPPPMRLFQRADINAVDVGLSGTRSFRLAVERLNLYLFSSGSAVIVLEISTRGVKSKNGWKLSDVQDFHDSFRRSYLPFANFDKESKLTADFSLVVSSVTWQDGSDKPTMYLLSSDGIGQLISGYLDNVEPDGRRIPPVFEHWHVLVEDALRIAPYAQGDGPRWHHVVDERMPTIATVAVAEGMVQRTRRGDLVRLCFADHWDRDEYPYDPEFLRDFEKKHVYGRFRHMNTLYLTSGYAFVAYGSGRFFEDVIAIHMRRHYFQMGLLAQFELASLLSFSTRVSRAVAELDRDGFSAEQFEQTMHAIEDQVLQFVHRYQFTQVSNHLQGQELFNLWRRHLRLKDIFQDLHAEITSATTYLFNRAASRSARMTERLSMIAALGVILGLAFSALGMNVLVQPLFGPKIETSIVLDMAIVVGTSTLFGWLGYLGFRALRRLGEEEATINWPAKISTLDRRFEKWLLWGAVAGLIVSLVLALTALVFP